jgi:aryl-alcohol dehydrogenase-like predicted oxidoreductase
MDRGVTFFDTAPGYASGKSEMIIGKAIGENREKIFINSKFGHKADGSSDFRVESIEASVKDSLNRLQTDYLDSVILHNPAFYILEGKTDHFKEMARLKSIGLTHHYGVSIDSYDELKATLENTDSTVIELLFNVFSQACLPLFDEIKRRKILLIIKVPLDSGWLTGKHHELSQFSGIRSRWTKADIHRRAQLVKNLKMIVNDEHLTPYALSFIWSFPAVSVVIPGTRSIHDLDDNLQALKFPLNDHFKEAFIQLYKDSIAQNPLPW